MGGAEVSSGWTVRERCRRANWKHGRRSAKAIGERKEVAAIRKAIRLLISEAHTVSRGDGDGTHGR